MLTLATVATMEAAAVAAGRLAGDSAGRSSSAIVEVDRVRTGTSGSPM